MKRSLQDTDRTISPPPTKRKLESTTTSKAVASFFKPASQKDPEALIWKTLHTTLITGTYTGPDPHQAQRSGLLKIAAFDLDDTLIKSKQGGKSFARNANSHMWWDDSVPKRLRELHDDGFAIAILTNQKGISLKDNAKVLQKDSTSLKNFKDQLTFFLRQLSFPVFLCAATESDEYRKPRTGMWKELTKMLGASSDDEVDIKSSFYIGDAAGREKTDKRQKDHATSDRDLAANIGVKFQTPEEFFLGLPTEPYNHPFEPKEFLQSALSQTYSLNPFRKGNNQELVIFCGSPGAGKSSFFWKHLQPQGFERVNQDTLKTRDKCIKVARQYLEDGLSVVVDNTNRDKEARAHWVKLAKEFTIPIRCVLFTAPAKLCEHNDAVRAYSSILNPEGRTVLPPIAFRSFATNYVEPDLSEGFQDITRINFEFTGTEDQKEVWSRYWVSKFSSS